MSSPSITRTETEADPNGTPRTVSDSRDPAGEEAAARGSYAHAGPLTLRCRSDFPRRWAFSAAGGSGEYRIAQLWLLLYNLAAPGGAGEGVL